MQRAMQSWTLDFAFNCNISACPRRSGIHGPLGLADRFEYSSELLGETRVESHHAIARDESVGLASLKRSWIDLAIRLNEHGC